MARLENIDIPAPSGYLEGLLRIPDTTDTPPRMAAVVCHPHPQFGGTMHNKVAFRISQALGDCGIPSLRFNFRGVGRSSGTYDNGRGEQADVRAALDELERRYPGLPLCAAGISFGAWVCLPVGCTDARVTQLLGVGVPIEHFREGQLSGCTKPKLIVQGEHDEFGPKSELVPWFDDLPDPKTLTIIAGSDHLFTRHQNELYAAIVDYFRSLR